MSFLKNTKIFSIYLGQILFFIFFIFPIIWILIMSFKEFRDIIAYPPRFIFKPTLDNYSEILFGPGGIANFHGFVSLWFWFSSSPSTVFSGKLPVFFDDLDETDCDFCI